MRFGWNQNPLLLCLISGLQPGEEEFSDTAATIGDAGAQQKVAFVPDEASIEAITNMGFSRNAGANLWWFGR